MSVTLERPAGGDVIDVLLAQHEQISQAMARIETLHGDAKAAAFDDLVELLARHERGEQRVVHPATRHDVTLGDQIAGERTFEERNADEAVAQLRAIAVDNPLFDVKFAQLRNAVSCHAAREETDEFPRLRASLPADELVRLADELIAAESGELDQAG